MSRYLWLVLLIPVGGWSQGRDPYLGVQRFRGSVTFRHSSSGNVATGAGTYRLLAEARATFLLERQTQIGATPTWAGRLIDSATTLQFESRVAAGSCWVNEKYDIAGPLEPGSAGAAHDVTVSMLRDYWGFSLSRWRGPTVRGTNVGDCSPNPAQSFPFTVAINVPNNVTNFPYPSAGGPLRMESTTRLVASLMGMRANLGTLTWQFTFTLEPDEGDLRLELTADEWRRWRPTARRDGAAGEPLTVTATVVDANGRPAPSDVEQFEWELRDTSREPGIAMNWPTEARVNDQREFDLRFDPGPGQVALDEDRQRFITVVQNAASDEARIVPYDWGGWSTLRVTAVLRGGRRLTGRLRGASEDDLRLPRRRAESLIADQWLEEQGVAGKSDGADDEDSPRGDGGDGDGLTLYEEYRGFYEDRRHVDGDPLRKDYFAVNRGGGEIEAGLALFARLTGLAVHARLLGTELDSARVVNGNYSAAPHLVDQHGVVYQNAGFSGFSRAQGGPGTPKDIEFVGLQTNFAGGRTFDPGVSRTVSTIAHEALHTVNVFHHGRGDRAVVWSAPAGVLLEDGAPIRALGEGGGDVSDANARIFGPKPQKMHLGVEGGQHSGVEDCVMRYDNAEIYVSKADALVRYVLAGEEVTGAGLCDDTVGTGVNAPARNTPQPRYFDATIGKCRSQIRVSDRGVAPKR